MAMTRKITKIGIILLFLASVVILTIKLSQRSHKQEITLKPTIATIQSVKPTGILYLYSTITEEYAKGSFMGSGLGSSILGKDNGILKKKHDCVQVLRQQINFTLDLDKITYMDDPEAGSNRAKARQIAQETISAFLAQCGREAVFVE